MTAIKNETWLPIPDWEGLYEVSDAGRVRSQTRLVKHRRFGPGHYSCYQGRLLKPSWTTGYAVVNLVETGCDRRRQRYIHDLVLEAFVGTKPAGLEVCHGPRGATCNALTNLRYDTRRENALDRKRFAA